MIILIGPILRGVIAVSKVPSAMPVDMALPISSKSVQGAWLDSTGDCSVALIFDNATTEFTVSSFHPCNHSTMIGVQTEFYCYLIRELFRRRCKVSLGIALIIVVVMVVAVMVVIIEIVIVMLSRD